MRLRIIGVAMAAIVSICAASGPNICAASGPSKTPLALQIAPSDCHTDTAWIILRFPADHFHVIVTNVSPAPVAVWKDNNSWAWFNLSFVLAAASGKDIQIQRKPSSWSGNIPWAYTIAPGAQYVIDVNFFDGTWLADGKSIDSATKSEPWFSRNEHLRAVYTIPEDEQTGYQHVWTGSIASSDGLYSFDVGVGL